MAGHDRERQTGSHSVFAKGSQPQSKVDCNRMPERRVQVPRRYARRIRAAKKASPAQQGIRVTVSEPELLLGPHDRAQRRLPAGQHRQGNEASIVHRTRAAEAIGDAPTTSGYADFSPEVQDGLPPGGTPLSSSDCRRYCKQRLLNDRRQRLASPQSVT
jgi:hypothetical protein